MHGKWHVPALSSSFWDICQLIDGFAFDLSPSIMNDRSGAILYLMSHMINLF